MSASDSYKDIVISQVYDPRCSVRDTILGSDTSNVNFIIDRVSENIQYYNYTADSTGPGQIAFNNITIDPNQGLGSMLLITVPVTLAIVPSGTLPALDTTVLGYNPQPNAGAPRSSLFMKNSSNVQLSLNGTNVTEATRYYLHAVSHYGGTYDSLISQYSFLMRSCLDNNYEYTPGTNSNVLSGYNDMPVANGVSPRGAFQNIQWTVTPAGVNGSNSSVTFIDILYTEVIPVSPLNIADKLKYCLAGISQLGVQINLTPELKYLWSAAAVFPPLPAPQVRSNPINEALSRVFVGQNASITISGAGGGTFTHSNIYGNQAKMYYQLFNIPPEQTDGIQPSLRNYVYPWNNTNNFTTSYNAALAPGAKAVVTSNSITPQGIPKYIYCWAEMQDGDRSTIDPYWFLGVEQITVNFLNKQNTLNSIIQLTGQPFNTLLYTWLCSKNGYKGSLAQFSRCPVICISPEDLNIDAGMLTGMQQQSSLTITMNLVNNSQITLTNGCVMHITLVYEGAMFYQGGAGGGTITTMNNIVNPSLLQNAQILDTKQYYFDHHNRDYLGGLSMKQLFDSAKGVARSVLKGAQTVAPYVAKYAPVALAALGAGSGGGFVAGQQLGKKYLKDRL